MKIKNIVSLFLAASMALASFSMTAFAATSTDVPQFKVTVDELTADDFLGDNNPYSGYKEFFDLGMNVSMVSFALTNVEMATTVSDMLKVTNGQSVTGATIQFTATAPSGERDTDWMVATHSSIKELLVDIWSGSMYTGTFCGTAAIYPAADKAAHTVAKADVSPALYTCAVVTAPDNPVTLTLESGSMVVIESIKNNAVEANTALSFKKENGNLAFSANDVTIPYEEVAKTYADVSYTEDATEAVNGYKNAGVLATFTVDAQANYAVSALWLKGDKGTAKVTFPEITSGTGKVAINVTNVPSDVTLTAKGLAITSYDPASN